MASEAERLKRELKEEHKQREREQSLAERIIQFATIAPLTPHRFDEENAHTGLAERAGYGGPGGHDALDGPDRMVTGEVDAMAEMQVESWTEGGPLDLDPYESLYEDTAGFGDLSLTLAPEEDPANCDWCKEMRL